MGREEKFFFATSLPFVRESSFRSFPMFDLRCSMFECRHTLGTVPARAWHGQNLDKQGLGTVSRPFTPTREIRIGLLRHPVQRLRPSFLISSFGTRVCETLVRLSGRLDA